MRKLLIDHHELLKPAGEPSQKPGITEAVVMDVSVSQHLHPTRPEPHLWSGMILQAKGDLAGAAAAYNASAALAAPYDWQGSYRLWRALLLLGDGAAAAREEAALRRRWGATRRCDGTAQTLMVTYCPPRRSERRCPCRISSSITRDCGVFVKDVNGSMTDDESITCDTVYAVQRNPDLDEATFLHPNSREEACRDRPPPAKAQLVKTEEGNRQRHEQRRCEVEEPLRM